jgi:serine/threonine protein kinase
MYSQIVDAMTYLHDHHVAHGNIQIKNLLMTQNGQIKLIGFEVSQDFTDHVNDPDSYGLTTETPGK